MGGGSKGTGWGPNFKKFVNSSNEWKKRHKCLILMLNLKVSKQTRSFRILQKGTLQKSHVILNQKKNIT